ncbi:MAG: hypothetical protein RR415_13950 [Ruthenibacterium sp.]
MTAQKKSIPKQIELYFDILYLLTAVFLGIYLLVTAKDSTARLLWGMMSLTLAGGDAFHLVPRILAAASGDTARYRKAMGYGKMLTSITMTLFYLLLWHCGLLLFAQHFPLYTALIRILAVLRIALCLFPQNKWASATPSYRWGIWRNIPFVIIGGMVLALFACFATPQLKWMGLAILLSFAFYIPVVLWANKQPKLGMLMLPKTLAYVWMLTMGLAL